MNTNANTSETISSAASTSPFRAPVPEEMRVHPGETEFRCDGCGAPTSEKPRLTVRHKSCRYALVHWVETYRAPLYCPACRVPAPSAPAPAPESERAADRGFEYVTLDEVCHEQTFTSVGAARRGVRASRARRSCPQRSRT